MSRNAVNITLIDEQLFLFKDEKKIPVDAVNYPHRRQIDLHKQTWQYMINLGFDVNHLILHEFMGLAVISDVNGISSKLIPPSRSPLDFESNNLYCDAAVKYTKIQNDKWHIRDKPSGQKSSPQFSLPVRLNKNPNCALIDNEAKSCLKYANDYKTKTAKVRIPIEFDHGDFPGGSYSIDASINFVSSYYAYGWGAASRTAFLRKPQLQIIWELIYSNQGREQVLGIFSQDTEKTDEFLDQASLVTNIPVPAFMEVLKANNYRFSLAPYQGEIASPFHSYSIAGFLEQTARDAGYTDEISADRFITQNILKGASGNAIPFRVYVQCTLKNR